MRKLIIILISLLCLSVSFNLFQYSTQQITCSKIDKEWKADLLYKIWHTNLDRDGDWIPCEHLIHKKVQWNV